MEEVVLYCTVTGAGGTPVADLRREDFSILEDRKSVPLAYFSHDDVPISLALLLDGSGSMKAKRAAVATAALDLIRASNPEDESSVTNFADSAYRDQALTTDVTALQHALEQNKSVSGGTALYDTVISSADDLAGHAHHSRQVMVVITDGHDNASAADLAATIGRIQRGNGPEIYTIGLLYDTPSSDAGRAKKELRALAEQTGGMSFFPASLADVDRVALEVAKDIRSQYTLAFHPMVTGTDDQYHRITVRAKKTGEAGLQVRTRAGFVRAPSREQGSEDKR